MIPYLFAAGHWQYSRYITWHVTEMRNDLPDEAEEFYLKGQHVCRHRDGVWNAVSSDQFGEQTYIRYGKARGGLVGLTLSPDQVAGWVLSNNVCNMVSFAMDKTFDDIDEEYDAKLDIHKEEGKNRQKLDAEDRNKIRLQLLKHVHPLKSETDKLINIVTGCIAHEKVNVNNALEIGERMAYNYQKSLPDGFYKPLKHEVVTMVTMKKCIKVGDNKVYDMEKLYGRMLVLSQKREIELSTVFKYELAPVPSSLFDEYGQLRKSSKAPFVHKLGILDANKYQPEVKIFDGNEMIYNVTWPKSGRLHHFVDTFMRAVQDQHAESYVVFDKYDDNSPKTHERNRRTGSQVLQEYSMTIGMELPPRDAIMKNTSNKKQLIKLLCDHGSSPKVKLIGEEQCLFNHEEADVNIISYVLHVVMKNNAKNIQVVADDNDIFVLLVHFTWKWSFPDVHITMKKSNGTVIDINASANALGEKCKDLLAVHALTGCDSTSYPFGKGKVSAINNLIKNDLKLDCIGNPDASKEQVIDAGRHLFRLLYGSTRSDITLDELRHQIFSKKKVSPKIKMLPPTEPAAEQHFLRAHFQYCLWKSAEEKDPPALDITNYGWRISDGTPEPIIGVSQMAPMELLKVVACGCASTDIACYRNSCTCKTSGVSCTSYCKCTAQEMCHNPNTIHDEVCDDENDSHGESDDGSDTDD